VNSVNQLMRDRRATVLFVTSFLLLDACYCCMWLVPAELRDSMLLVLLIIAVCPPVFFIACYLVGKRPLGNPTGGQAAGS